MIPAQGDEEEIHVEFETLNLGYTLFITEAIYPAPNPLSIFTTAIFELQLFNMAKRAVKPPKFTP